MALNGTAGAPANAREARAAGLRYVSDAQPGIARRRAGKGFSYVLPDGTSVRDRATLRRIRALAIPPAWAAVWICPDPLGHIQAVGRDQRGRKQYRYHARWREVRDANKYERMTEFARVLPAIRARVAEDIARPGLPRQRVLATIVSLLERTLIRVGNEDYAQQNNSYGLTTLRNRHVEVEGGSLRFRFKGKSGREWDLSVSDRRVARIVRALQDLPGQDLFQYLDENGEVREVSSADVNQYLRDIAGAEITAKDFRTWAGTVLAATTLTAAGLGETKAAAKRHVATAIREVAERLGNTPAICRRCYVHPDVLERYITGSLSLTESGIEGLRSDEAAVLVLLEECARAASPSPRARRPSSRQ